MGGNGSYMKRSHARTLQLSSKLFGYVLYTVLYTGIYLIIKYINKMETKEIIEKTIERLERKIP